MHHLATHQLPTRQPPHVNSRRATRARAADTGAGAGALRPLPLPADFTDRVAAQFERRAAGYDAAAPAYHAPLAARLVALAAPRPGERVVDVACGTGLVALAAARAVGAYGRVLGMDLSPAMLERAAANAAAAAAEGAATAAVEWRAGDADAAAPGLACWDVVLCSSALPFFRDAPATLARWATWLRPGGRAAFNAPRGVGSRVFTAFAAAAAARGVALADPSAQFGDLDAVRAMLAAAGYARADVRTSPERSVRRGATPAAWAAAGWDACAAMPFADIAAALPPAEVAAMREDYMRRAVALAEAMSTADGDVVEPYEMVWVCAWTRE